MVDVISAFNPNNDYEVIFIRSVGGEHARDVSTISRELETRLECKLVPNADWRTAKGSEILEELTELERKYAKLGTVELKYGQIDIEVLFKFNSGGTHKLANITEIGSWATDPGDTWGVQAHLGYAEG